MRLSDANNSTMGRRKKLNTRRVIEKLFNKIMFIDCEDSMPTSIKRTGAGVWCVNTPLGSSILDSLNGISYGVKT